MEPGRTAQGRLAFAGAIALAVVACGGARQQSAAEPEPTAEQRACGRYGVRIAPFLDRFGAALDVYDTDLDVASDDSARGDAARKFADFIAAELDGVKGIAVRHPALGPAHDQLVGALEAAAGGLDQLATGYALGDDAVRRRALARISDAFNQWSTAARRIMVQCPGTDET